jgi:hypothetical protein
MWIFHFASAHSAGRSHCSVTLALERRIHARAGGSSAQQLSSIVAIDLALFEKYGLDLDLLEIRGGSLFDAGANRPEHNRHLISDWTFAQFKRGS